MPSVDRPFRAGRPRSGTLASPSVQLATRVGHRDGMLRSDPWVHMSDLRPVLVRVAAFSGGRRGPSPWITGNLVTRRRRVRGCPDRSGRRMVAPRVFPALVPGRCDPDGRWRSW